MGPATMKWYRDRGLTLVDEHVATENTMFYSKGETYTREIIIASYSCGRIDVRGVPDEPYGLEIGVPPMLTLDWQRFGRWLDDVETVAVWTLADLVAAYEFQTQTKITWDTYEPTT